MVCLLAFSLCFRDSLTRLPGRETHSPAFQAERLTHQLSRQTLSHQLSRQTLSHSPAFQADSLSLTRLPGRPSLTHQPSRQTLSHSPDFQADPLSLTSLPGRETHSPAFLTPILVDCSATKETVYITHSYYRTEPYISLPKYCS